VGVFVDRLQSGPYSNATVQGGPIPLPPLGLQVPAVTLRVFVDRSLLEVIPCSWLFLCRCVAEALRTPLRCLWHVPVQWTQTISQHNAAPHR
jgi:hypothetical protein